MGSSPGRSATGASVGETSPLRRWDDALPGKLPKPRPRTSGVPSRASWVGRELEPAILPRLVSPLAGSSAVVVLAVLTFGIVRATGGSPNPLNHLGYLPVLLAAYLFGARAAVATAIGVAVLLGPVAAALRLPGGTEDVLPWASRGLMFLVVGLAVGILFARLHRAVGGLESAAIEIIERQQEGMVALARGAEARDHATGEHIFRCRALATALAVETGVARSLADDIGWAAMLHDIGKLHIPDRILLKPGPLTPEEWEVMRRHPVWGEQILQGGIGFEVARRIARWHHEDFDGRGYPDGLRSDAIPLEARIVRIADAYDAMTHDRPYKPAAPPEWAFDELRRFAGSQFDPELVQLFLTLLERGERLRMADGVRVRILDVTATELRTSSRAGGGREIL